MMRVNIRPFWQIWSHCQCCSYYFTAYAWHVVCLQINNGIVCVCVTGTYQVAKLSVKDTLMKHTRSWIFSAAVSVHWIRCENAIHTYMHTYVYIYVKILCGRIKCKTVSKTNSNIHNQNDQQLKLIRYRYMQGKHTLAHVSIHYTIKIYGYTIVMLKQSVKELI